LHALYCCFWGENTPLWNLCDSAYSIISRRDLCVCCVDQRLGREAFITVAHTVVKIVSQFKAKTLSDRVGLQGQKRPGRVGSGRVTGQRFGPGSISGCKHGMTDVWSNCVTPLADVTQSRRGVTPSAAAALRQRIAVRESVHSSPTAVQGLPHTTNVIDPQVADARSLSAPRLASQSAASAEIMLIS